MPSSFAPSVDTSLPSNVLLVVMAPVIAPPDLGNALAAAAVPAAFAKAVVAICVALPSQSQF